MSLFVGFFQTLGARLFGIAALMVGSVVAARMLGPAGKGVVVVLGTLAATIVQFGGLGLTAANVHFAARVSPRVVSPNAVQDRTP